MRGRRFLYLAAFVCAAAFYVFHSGHASFILFCAAALILPLDFLFALAMRWGSRARLWATQQEVPAGQPAILRCAVHAVLCAGTLRTTLVCKNILTGEVHRQKWWVHPARSEDATLTFTQQTAAAIQYSLHRPVLLGAMGLVALPLKKPPDTMVLFYPLATTSPPQLPESATRQSVLTGQDATRPGPGGVREYTDMRAYREGDSLRDVHWKLSAKLDKLVVREASFPAGAALHLGLHFFGTPQQLTQRLARLAAFSGKLTEIERSHCIHWHTPAGPQACHIESKQNYSAFLWQLLATPLPQSGPSMQGALPETEGLFLLVEEECVEFYEHGLLKEVL